MSEIIKNKASLISLGYSNFTYPKKEKMAYFTINFANLRGKVLSLVKIKYKKYLELHNQELQKMSFVYYLV